MQACFWQPNAWVPLVNYAVLLLATLAIASSTLASGYKVLLFMLYAMYAVLFSLRLRQVKHLRYGFGLRYGKLGWQLWTSQAGWQVIEVQPQSIVLPWLIIVYYRRPQRRFLRSLVISEREIGASAHRKLRVQIRFAS